MTSRFFWAVCGAIAVMAGCSSGFTTGTGAGGGATTSTDTTSGGTGGKTGSTSTTGTTTTITGSSSSITTGPATCPNLGGTYTMIASGLGCGDLNTTAGECIKADNVPCEFTIDTSGMGMSGTVDVDSTGGFMNASLKLGSVVRSGCVGTLTSGAAAKSIIVDCGGIGTSQSCHIVLTRTADGCTF